MCPVSSDLEVSNSVNKSLTVKFSLALELLHI